MGVIAVATNFTERADRALRRAGVIARNSGDELLIVHVLEEGGERRDAAEAKLAAISKSLLDIDGLRSTIEVRAGKAAGQICDAATGANAHLVVLGAHRRALSDMVEDTTAQGLVRLCKLPILIANCLPDGDYERAFFSTDLSESNLHCADKVKDQSLISSDKLIPFHVYDPEALTMLGRALADGEERRAYLDAREERAKEEMRDWIARSGLPAAGFQVRPSVGSIPEDIIVAAGEQSVDLIVLCNRNEGAVKRMVVGSVTDALLRNVDIDVYVTPPME